MDWGFIGRIFVPKRKVGEQLATETVSVRTRPSKVSHRCGRCNEGFSTLEKYLDHRCPKRDYRTPRERYD